MQNPRRAENVYIVSGDSGQGVTHGAIAGILLTDLIAACTRLKCIVGWNSAEKTWDCPCHGSRFDPYGKVLNGPAVTDLPPVEG